MTLEVVISKGNYSVTIHVNNFSEEYANKLTILPIPQVSSNQSSGAKDTKILDLLRLTHNFIIKGSITASNVGIGSNKDSGGSASLTAIECKEILKNIVNGASINGGTCTMIYDGNSYEGYIEKVVMVEESQDDPITSGYTGVDQARYEVNLTFVEGVSIGV